MRSPSQRRLTIKSPIAMIRSRPLDDVVLKSPVIHSLKITEPKDSGMLNASWISLLRMTGQIDRVSPRSSSQCGLMLFGGLSSDGHAVSGGVGDSTAGMGCGGLGRRGDRGRLAVA